MKTFVAFFAVLAVAVAAPTLPLVQIIVNVDAPADAVVIDKPVLPEPVVIDPVHVVDNPIIPEPIIIPTPVFPEVIIPGPVILPEPVLPEVIVPEPVVLPQPVLPEVVIPGPVVLPQPEVIMPVPEFFPLEDLDSN